MVLLFAPLDLSWPALTLRAGSPGWPYFLSYITPQHAVFSPILAFAGWGVWPHPSVTGNQGLALVFRSLIFGPTIPPIVVQSLPLLPRADGSQPSSSCNFLRWLLFLPHYFDHHVLVVLLFHADIFYKPSRKIPPSHTPSPYLLG